MRPGVLTASRIAAAGRRPHAPAGVWPWLAAATAAVAFCTLAIPLLHAGLPAGHDLPAHLTYAYLFDRAAGAGQLPVRWTQHVRVGDAQPLFSFYQPGFYYLVQLVHLVVPSLLLSVKLTVLGCWIAGTTAMYRWWAPLGWMPATAGALVFAASPYLLLDLYVRAVYPEIAAIGWSVVSLRALDRLTDQPSGRRAAIVALALGAALVCHLPATLVFAPVLAGQAIAGIARSPTPRAALAWSLAAAALALGLAAFYVLPALGEQHLIQMGALTSSYFDYRRHFVEPAQWLRFTWGYGGSEPGAADGMSFQVGIVQWLVVIVAAAVCVASIASRRAARAPRPIAAWLAVVAFALFMTSAASAPVWAAAPPLAFLQFPWRFLMLVSVAGGCLTAILVGRLRTPRGQAMALLALAAALVAASHAQRRPDHYVLAAEMDIDRPAWANSTEGRAAAFVEPGYFPRGPATAAPERAAAPEPHPRWRLSAPGGVVTPRTVLDHVLVLDVSAASAGDLVLAWRPFPGWTFHLDGAPIAADIDPATGFVRLRLPPGRHTIAAAFGDTPLRRTATLVSAASAAAVAIAVAPWRRRRDQAPPIA